jgi:hypothetical protein
MNNCFTQNPESIPFATQKVDESDLLSNMDIISYQSMIEATQWANGL